MDSQERGRTAARYFDDDLQRAQGKIDRGVEVLENWHYTRSSSSSPENGLSKSMNPEIYKATTTGDIDAFRQVTEDRELLSPLVDQLTPQHNTVLHLATSSGHDHLVKFILTLYPDLLKKKNSAGNLALHVAASAGHKSTANILVSFEHQSSVSSMANEEGNTPLHVALMNKHQELAMLLVESDPIMSGCLNRKGKSPLHIAAEAGWLELVKAMVEKMPHHALTGAEDKAPLLHAAITGRNRDILDTILSKDSTLISSRDEKGRSPLLYAASLGYLEGVQYLIPKLTEAVYQSDKNGIFPIHAASVEGHIEIIEEFLRHCPDTIELCTEGGQNILHIAAMNGKSSVVSYVLKKPKLERLINERDLAGNTPLHLATNHWHPKVVSDLTWDSRVNLELVDNQGSTPLDAASRYNETVLSLRMRLTWKALRIAGAPRAQNRSRNVHTSRPAPNAEIYKDRTNTLLLVSTLVATVTFAAGITMPGGNNDSDPDQGMATFVKEHAFHVFLICDTLAMYSATIVAIILIWAQLGDLTMVLTAFKLALPLLGVALTTMSIAFIASVYLVVSNLNWLAILVWVMGSIFLATFLLVFLPLFTPNSPTNRITRHIFYYPFYLIMWVTNTHK